LPSYSPVLGTRENINQFFAKIHSLSISKVLKANNIQVRKLYNLRHTFASQLIAVGEDITWVSRTLGHKDTQTTLMYYTKFSNSGY